MVAFKEEFPYLRSDSGQLFEFNRDWLHAEIKQAADRAGYPRWWLTEHVTESIAFYLRLRTDESVVAFSQLNPNCALRFESDRLQGNRARIFGRLRRRFRFRSTRSPKRPARDMSWRFSTCWRNASSRSWRQAHRNAFFWSAAGDQTSPRREDLDAFLRRLARRSHLFYPRKDLQRGGSGARLNCSIR